MNRFGLFSLLLFLPLLAGCGEEVVSTAVSAIDPAPSVIFFNDNSAANVVLLTGTAVDGVQVTKVEVSCDNGLTWKTASLPDGAVAHASWALSVRKGAVSNPFSILLRAGNSAGNLETPHLVASGPSVASTIASVLKAGLEGGWAGSVFLLSSGSGGAYHFSAGGVEPAAGILVSGTAAGGIAGLPSTVLSAGSGAEMLFSVSSPFALRGVRVTGGRVGLDVHAPAGAALGVGVEDCWFGPNEHWGIRAVGQPAGADSLFLSLLRVQVEAAGAVLGGVYGESANLSLFDCRFAGATNKTEMVPLPGALSLVSASSATWIDSCLFTNNGFSINASGTSALITSCTLDGGGNQVNGIRLNGNADTTPILQRNLIRNNGGFGVGILGSVAPILYRNAITGNGTAAGGVGGIFVKGAFPLYQVNLGNQLQPTLSGYNVITGNRHAGSTVGGAVFVDPTTTGLAILAENNWWGTADQTTIGTYVWDAADPGGTLVVVDHNPCLGATP